MVSDGEDDARNAHAFDAFEILRETARLLRAHAMTLARIGVAAMGPALVLQALTVWRMEASTRSLEVIAASLGDSSGGELALVRAPYLVVTATVAVVGMLVAQGAMTHASSEALAHRRPEIRASLAVGLRCLRPLFAQHLVVSALVIGGLLLLVIPGIFAVVAYFLVYGVAGPAVVIEGASAIDGLDRSSDLTRDHRTSIALSFTPVAFALVSLASSSVAATVATAQRAQAAFGPDTFVGALFAAFAGMLPQVAYVAVATTYWVVVYDRARRAEVPSVVTRLARSTG